MDTTTTATDAANKPCVEASKYNNLVKRHTSQTPRRPAESAAVMDTGRGDVDTNACCSGGCAGE